MKRWNTRAQVTKSRSRDGSLYGIMAADFAGRIKVSRAVAWLTLGAVLFSLCLSPGIMIGDHAKAAPSNNNGKKTSSDLDEKAHGPKKGNTVKVILQLDAPMSDALTSFLDANGVRVKAKFNNLKAHAIEMPARLADELASFDEVAYVSLDRPTQSMGHVSATTGADLVRPTTGSNGARLDGTGIGIAVLDSGAYSSHVSFLGNSGNVRVVYSQDFTGENRTDDPYGHGSHVASIAAGNGRVSNAAYLGIAPNANLINLRVLNSLGTGTTAATLAALDWIMTNKATYNIRVVNMSLGTPAVDSYKNDPICRSVRRLVNAGVVVVVAAGNNGKNAAGQKLYGMIHCPGNEPSAITVGAANTFGTDARNDDGVTTYSSRGPTRSYWTDSAGLKHYDGLMKPDLVAPGNKIIAVEAYNNLLVTQNPLLDANVSINPKREEMILNGTSMATPVVAGAAALLLQVNPSLTPNMVKAILEYTAQPLSGFNTLEQGAGEVNIEGAVRLARLVRTDFGNTKPVGAAFLNTTTLPTPQTTIAGFTFNWTQGILLGQHWAKGTSLISKYQPVYALGTIISDGTTLSNGSIVSDGVMVSEGVIITAGVIVADGVIVTDGTITADGVIATDGTMVSDKILLSTGITISSGTLLFRLGTIVGDGVIVTDGTVVSDGVVASDGSIVSDGVVTSDAFVAAQSAAISGDLTSALTAVIDTGIDCLTY